MKRVIPALLALFFTTPALAVSQADIDALFAHPPMRDGTDMNQLLESASGTAPSKAPVATQIATPQSLASLSPAAGANRSAALTTTNATPAQQQQFHASANASLRNMFDVAYTDAEAAVSTALAERGIADKVSALMDGHKNAAIFSYSEPTHVEIRGLQVDKDHNRWSANLLFTSLDGSVISAIPAAGHYSEVTEVPVLKRAIRNGEIISESDVELRDFATSRTQSDTVRDLSSLIGKTPLHNVSPFRPIHQVEIINMPILKRDAIVQIEYNVPGMHISTAGQALAAGARGDVIDVRNTTSRKVVRAVITSPEHVQVLTPDTQTSQLTSSTPQ